MKTFTISLLCIIFVALITSSIPPIIADESFDNEEFFEDSKYKIYLHVLVRNAQGELVTVAETLPCELGSYCSEYMDHEVTDYAFDKLGKKEIITIDNVKYEKIQYTGMLDIEQLLLPSMKPSHFIGNWVISLCKVFDKHGYTCIAPWQANSSFVSLEEDDVVKNYWTILRIIN